MRVSQRFPIAVHSMLFIACFGHGENVASTLVAESTGANAVIIRNLFSELKEKGLLIVSSGKNGGARLARDISEITMWDIYSAVETDETDEIFKFHDANKSCPIGRNIYSVMYTHTVAAIDAMRAEFESVTLADLITELNDTLKKEADLEKKE